MERAWTITRGRGPVVATAIHAGHGLREDAASLLALDEATQLREEDPYTDLWATRFPTHVTVQSSRFQIDLNRPPERAVYRTPEEAWGLQVWRQPLPRDVLERSLAEHTAFYADLEQLLQGLLQEYRTIVVLDLHSYCHRRGGPDAPVDDPEANPEINVGTGSVDRQRWGSLIDRLMQDLAQPGPEGRPLDVRENVRFRGAYFGQYINHRHGASACAISLEMKKIFMDEWSGQLHQEVFDLLGQVLESVQPGLLEELQTR